MNLEYNLELLLTKLKGSDEDFIDAARKALIEWKLDHSVSEEDVLALALKRDLPQQWYGEHGFGHFNVTFYNQDFVVQIYLMRSMPTEIHDHGFYGAFKSLAGRNLHTDFVFDKAQNESDYVSTGELRNVNSHIMEVGDVVSLQKAGIHQVHRLNDRSITLLVSKNQDIQNHYYLHPNYRIKNRPNNTRSRAVSRKLMAVRLLHEMNSSIFTKEARGLLEWVELDELFGLGTRLGGSEYGHIAKSDGQSFEKDLLRLLEERLNKLGHGGALQSHNSYLSKRLRKARLIE